MKLVSQTALEEDLGTLYEIIVLCGEDLKNKYNLTHWSPPIPFHRFAALEEGKRIYLVKDISKNRIIATYTIKINKNKDEMFVSKLAVLPEFQNRGIGSWCMLEIEKEARKLKIKTIRLKALMNHRRLVRFYHCMLNYEIVEFKNDADEYQIGKVWPVIVFEKKIE